jgi:hypothetical protein
MSVSQEGLKTRSNGADGLFSPIAENLKAEFVDDRLEPIKEPLVVSTVANYLLPPIAPGPWHGRWRLEIAYWTSPLANLPKKDPVATSIVKKHEKRV